MKANLVLTAQLLTIGLIFYAPFYEFEYSNLDLEPLSVHFIIGLISIFLGAFLFLASIFTMSTNFEVRAKQRSTSELVTKWPFSWVRNPIYLSGVFLSFGWSLFFLSLYAFMSSVLLIIILLIKVSLEEKFLTQQFGEPYKKYLKQVPRIIPRSLF